jgi:hypothetical protein
MKRLMIILLTVVALLSGCCYAPGHEGGSALGMRYELPEWLVADYELAKETQTQPTEPQVHTPLPTPEVDLEALPERKDSDIGNALE